MPIKYRRLSTLRTFIGKGSLKHTSQKILLTFYVYDLEKRVLYAKFRNIFTSFFNEENKLEYEETMKKVRYFRYAVVLTRSGKKKLKKQFSPIIEIPGEIIVKKTKRPFFFENYYLLDCFKREYFQTSIILKPSTPLE